jgi:hypothetical protein
MFGQLHNLIADFESLRAQVCGDLTLIDRTEQMPQLVGFGGDNSLGPFDCLSSLFEPFALQFTQLGAFDFFLGYRPNTGFVSNFRKTLWNQIISRVSGFDFNDVAKPAKFINIFTKQYFHIPFLVSRECNHEAKFK